jgi:hypothetical protein
VPFLGEFSVGIVALASLLRFTPTSLAPRRYLATIAGIGLVHTSLGSPYSTMKYLVPALMVVGLLVGLLDPRAAVAVTLTPLLEGITRFEWRAFGPSSGQVVALSILASTALIVALRRHPSGGAQPG